MPASGCYLAWLPCVLLSCFVLTDLDCGEDCARSICHPRSLHSADRHSRQCIQGRVAHNRLYPLLQVEITGRNDRFHINLEDPSRRSDLTGVRLKGRAPFIKHFQNGNSSANFCAEFRRVPHSSRFSIRGPRQAAFACWGGMSGKRFLKNLKRAKQPVHIYRSFFAKEIGTEAAPAPFLRRGNQAARARRRR